MLLSVAMSADGYIDDARGRGLRLSDAADADRVDELRAASDAIMVGARTIRTDNPRLLVRSEQRQHRRAAAGLPSTPRKVTITASADLDPQFRFFADASAPPLVYAPAGGAARAAATLAGVAEVVAVPTEPGQHRLDLSWPLADLAARGIGRLLVEGGASLLAQFLSGGVADELRLAIAPVFIADPRAPRLLGGARPAGRLRLAGLEQVGDMAVLRYLPSRPTC